MILRQRQNNNPILSGFYSRDCLPFMLFLFLIIFQSSCSVNPVNNPVNNGEEVEMFPDYKNITIPVNIAPLNFRLNSVSDPFFVIAECRDESLLPRINGSLVKFPRKKWKKFLAKSVSDTVMISVYLKADNKWKRFNIFCWYISADSIDPCLTYRLIDPGYSTWGKMGIYEREVSRFRQLAIFKNSYSENNCMNCHCFNAENPDEFLFHLRGKPGGTFIKTTKGLYFLDTKTPCTLSAGVYPSWHPSGRFVAMSTNRVKQVFRNHPEESIEVLDKASDIILLDIEKRMITTSPELCTRQRENMPCWNPRGDSLYFIRSVPLNDTLNSNDSRYDLYRIGFNEKDNSWGKIDAVFEASRIGKSVAFPKVSPCGRYILFTLTEYGYFTIHHKDADQYIFDLRKNVYFPLTAANSRHADSYHSWSSGGKWIVFSSKRLDGVCGRPYFAHIDSEGNASKAFVLPQKDPVSYTLSTQSYSIPEFSTGRVKVSKRKIRETVYRNPENVRFDTTVNLDALTGATEPNVADEGEPYIDQ